MIRKKVLILYAHPSQRRSEINQPLFRAARNIEGITTVDLYYEYPTYSIDIDREQQRLLEHDVVIFQFPMYWYSTPSILKEWQDLVLEYGFAYGHDGHALHGKTFFCALSGGARADAYTPEGVNQYSVRELLRPIEQMAVLTGMTYLPPFTLLGARTAKEEGRAQNHLFQWLRLLKALTEDRINVGAAAHLNTMNDDLDSVILGEPS